MRRRPEDDADPAEIADLVALADGSIAPERRAGFETRVAASDELADRLAGQQRAVALVRTAAAEVGAAPASLRARIEPARRARRAPARRRLIAVGSAAAVAVAVAIAVAVLRAGASGQELRAALTPTGLVPGATGHATLAKTPSGWQIELYTKGLPRRDGGRFYEAWLRNSAGALVPIGTFNDGSHEVLLWAGVSPEEFSTLTVTREQTDGSQDSSGEKVLVGTAKPG
jgi:Anti-sigma-K factor rskA, C-terminal